MLVLLGRGGTAFNQSAASPRVLFGRSDAEFIHAGRGSIRGLGGKVNRTLSPLPVLAAAVDVVSAVGTVLLGTGAGTVGIAGERLERKLGSYAALIAPDESSQPLADVSSLDHPELTTTISRILHQPSTQRTPVIRFKQTAHTSFPLVRSC